MDPQDAIELTRDALWIGMLISAPILVTGMLLGLMVGLAQALTQIQEQTVAFVPKMLAMAVILSLTLPWLLNQFLQYSSDLIAGIPGKL
ncbi:MAG: flagellar biosynthetic protein FliQ [Thermoguttaceae bacterium]|jgi:flagellar biosynthetic protein FliQ